MKTNYGPVTKYKHDTIGKFQILKELIESITDENVHNEEYVELIKEIQITFEKMKVATENLLNGK